MDDYAGPGVPTFGPPDPKPAAPAAALATAPSAAERGRQALVAAAASPPLLSYDEYAVRWLLAAPDGWTPVRTADVEVTADTLARFGSLAEEGRFAGPTQLQLAKRMIRHLRAALGQQKAGDAP